MQAVSINGTYHFDDKQFNLSQKYYKISMQPDVIDLLPYTDAMGKSNA